MLSTEEIWTELRAADEAFGIGAKKIIGRPLEPPFTKILDTFGTKGAVIVGIKHNEKQVKKGDPVFLKELRSIRLKNI